MQNLGKKHAYLANLANNLSLNEQPTHKPLRHFMKAHVGKKIAACYHFGLHYAARIFLLLLFFCGTNTNESCAQVTIIVTQTPTNTPDSSRLYIAGTFNNWAADHPDYELRKMENGTYSITLPDSVTTFEYKFTRGNWLAVEGNSAGKTIANRKFQADGQVATSLQLKILSWEDLAGEQVTFLVTSYPENTPHDASIYLVGNFNGWVPGNPEYKLKMKADSTFSITLPIASDTIEYKFTRGNWQSVEGRDNGYALANRRFIRPAGQKETVISNTVESWEDLAGRLVSPYNFVLLLAAFQGLLLILAIIGLQNNNRTANRLLAMLIFMLSVALIGRAIHFHRDVFNNFPKIYLIEDAIYFTYGPLFLFYMRELLTVQPVSNVKRWLHFLPLILLAVFYSPMIFEDKQPFIDNIVDKHHAWKFMVTGVAGAIFNAFYWYWCRKLLISYSHNYSKTQSSEQNLYYLKGVLSIQFVCVILWIASLLAGGVTMTLNGYDYITGLEYIPIMDLMIDTAWLVFSFTTFFMGYFAMTQPAIFRLKEEEISGKTIADPEDEKEAEPEELPEECQELIDGKLDEVMRNEKPYKDPQLSLSRLAQVADTKPHILSKAINEGYQKNFYDYINGYRVDEFKRLLTLHEYQNHTFLAIALEVGFNSKTAFNRAFKKLTDSTPRQYYSELKEKMQLAERLED